MPRWLAGSRLPSAPPDPIMLGAQGLRPLNYNSALGRILMHQSHMPIGRHAGMIMQYVPARYLLEKFATFKDQRDDVRKDWFPVYSYVERHKAEIELRALDELSRGAKVQRDYSVMIRCNLIAPDQTAKAWNPAHKCEVCLDVEATACTCNPQTRAYRNQKRHEASQPKRVKVFNTSLTPESPAPHRLSPAPGSGAHPPALPG